MTDSAILSRLDDQGVLTVTLNRPDAKNAFDTPMQGRMRELLYDASRDPGVRVVVLTGAGGAFSTGGDVRSLGAPDPADPLAQKWADQPIWSDHEARVDRLKRFAEVSILLHRMGKPTIAMIRGATAGAGLSLALACDFRIASESAFFVTSFVKIGMSGDYGGSYFLTKLVGPSKAKELYMLGDRIDARQAQQLGILNRLVAEDALETETNAFAQRLAKGPPIALRYIKENVQAALDEPLERVFETEARNMIRCRLTEDCREAMAAFKDKREPQFRGR
jgi:2-(1,2-epoxy-1,2-dihydrophenyl)acetyl-CoA isomerase